MARNLDMSALRALVAVAEMGGVTRAAAQVGLTQSAVSLQMRRLEEALGQRLVEKAGRGVVLTLQGEQVVAGARRLLALNDEIVARAAPATAGELRIGAPCDLLNLHLPQVLRGFAARWPQVRVALLSEPSAALREGLGAGALDLILATETETEAGPGAETLRRTPLVWVGAVGGVAWRRRPLPVGVVLDCAFTPGAIAALGASGLDWTIAAETMKSAVDGAVVADLAVHMLLEGTIPPEIEAIDHRGALPALPVFGINIYVTQGPRRALAELLAAEIRAAYASETALAAE